MDYEINLTSLMIADVQHARITEEPRHQAFENAGLKANSGKTG